MEKLPEKYCIKDCEVVTEFATNRFGCYNKVSNWYMHIIQSEFPKNKCYKFLEGVQDGYTEITLEQFKKLVLKNNNMENRMKITPPEGWEIDVEKSNLQTGEIIYKEKVKEKQLPETWEEYLISHNHITDNMYINELEALHNLLLLRDEYNEDWKPDWSEDSLKYGICFSNDKMKKSTHYEIQRVMVFKTEELRDKFYDNFKDLLKIAKELL